MNKSFSELSKLYLEPNGIIKKEGKKLFLASLPASRQSSRKTLFREWFGPHVKWKHLTSGIFSGDSGDSVTKIITDTEIYFFKLFRCSQRALREYLAYLYIAEWDLPMIKHVPIIKMGKLTLKGTQEHVYLISKMAKGLNGIEYVRSLLKKEGNLDSLKEMLKTLGTAMSTMHKKESYSFSETELLNYFTRWIDQILLDDSSFILLQFLKNPKLSTFYNDLQLSLQKFITHHKTGNLSLGLLTLANFSFLPGNPYIELFDQSI